MLGVARKHLAQSYAELRPEFVCGGGKRLAGVAQAKGGARLMFGEPPLPKGALLLELSMFGAKLSEVNTLAKFYVAHTR